MAKASKAKTLKTERIFKTLKEELIARVVAFKLQGNHT
jgi:hypothetical protein